VLVLNSGDQYLVGRLSGRQRIDKWLWNAHVVRTRAAAVGLTEAGHVRVNGRRINAASRPVQVGDIITVSLLGRVRVLKVTAVADRRGPGSAAKLLFEDLE
jgi:ribosome-associated heat shock protein Hsp15